MSSNADWSLVCPVCNIFAGVVYLVQAYIDRISVGSSRQGTRNGTRGKQTRTTSYRSIYLFRLMYQV